MFNFALRLALGKGGEGDRTQNVAAGGLPGLGGMAPVLGAGTAGPHDARPVRQAAQAGGGSAPQLHVQPWGRGRVHACAHARAEGCPWQTPRGRGDRVALLIGASLLLPETRVSGDAPKVCLGMFGSLGLGMGSPHAGLPGGPPPTGPQRPQSPVSGPRGHGGQRWAALLRGAAGFPARAQPPRAHHLFNRLLGILGESQEILGESQEKGEPQWGWQEPAPPLGGAPTPGRSFW